MTCVLPTNYDDLTQPERRVVRLEYIRRQDGKCQHCGEPLDGEPRGDIRAKKIDLRRFPPNFLCHPVHLHHSHRTGLTIGAVHARCNAVLWQYHGR